MSRRNNVRGPTSALTEFLKESGITPTTVARRVQARANANDQPVSGPSNTSNSTPADNEDNNDEVHEVQQPEDLDSDHLDDSEEEQPVPKRRKMSKAAEARAKAAAKAKAKKGKKAASDDEDDDDDDDDYDPYNALSKMWKSDLPKPSIGSFDNCARCEKQFTVTKYTLPANPPPGWLCTPCSKASGVDPYKQPKGPRKRKLPTEKRQVIHFEEKRFPSLASMCIQLISKHIDDVEALGDVGSVNMNEIAKAISRNRSLTPQNAPLFYDARNTNLILNDVTNLTPPALCTLASLNPNLTHLRLDLCGRMDDTVASAWSSALPNLKRLELFGPFLVRAPAWQTFCKSHPGLEGFLITQSPRFDLECIRTLVETSPCLRELRLDEIGKMCDAFLEVIKPLAGHLTSLSLAYPGDPLTLSEEAVQDLLGAVGGSLVHLNLSGNKSLSDGFLFQGIKPHSEALTSLLLADIPQFTNKGVAEFFNTWSQTGAPIISRELGESEPEAQNAAGSLGSLTHVDLSRNHELSGDALVALLQHSGPSLENLNINGWKATSQDALRAIAKHAPGLKKLDVGWCREINDGVILDLMQGCGRIEEIKVWGCQRLTAKCPRKRGVNIYGVEVQSLI